MPADQTTVFLHRPPGESASVIGGGVARVAYAERAVLQTAHGRVLVKSVKRGADGSFTGEIYAVMPREPEVAIGDHANFSERHVFAFKVADGAVPPSEPGAVATVIAKPETKVDATATGDDEIAQMARTFEASFGQLDTAAPNEEARPSAVPASGEASLFDMDISAALQDLPAPTVAPVQVQPPRSQPAAKAPKPQHKDAALSTAEAMSMLRAAEHKGSVARNATRDSSPARPPPAPRPIIETPKPPVTAPPPAPTARADAVVAQPRRADIDPAPRPISEAAATPPTPATKPAVAAPQRPVEPAVAPPRRVFEPNVTEKPATPAATAPESTQVPVIAHAPASRLQETEETPKPGAPIAPPPAEARITCRECGSPLSIPPAADDESPEEYRKVSCRSCGRINQVKNVKR